MPNIPSNRDYMNDIEISADSPLSEVLFNKMGANINSLLDQDWQTETFTSSGTFNVPEAVFLVYVKIIGGGGGGGGGTSVFGNNGGGGGSGGTQWQGFMPVTELTPYTVTIGSGGAGGIGGVDGSDGGNSSAFGITCNGGKGGLRGSAALADGFGYGGAYNETNFGRGYYTKGGNAGLTASTVAGNAGESNNEFSGGSGGSTGSGAGGGGGGGAGLAAGGAGGTGGAGTGTAGTSGSGGGGGGGASGGGAGTGGNGGAGKVIVYWYGNP